MRESTVRSKGVYGGLATGSVLIGYNNPSENSYGNEQSYNSGISEEMMKKYTEALNYLLASQKYNIMLEDMTMVFWAMDTEDTCEDLFSQLLFGESGTLNAEQTEEMLKKMMEDAKEESDELMVQELECMKLVYESEGIEELPSAIANVQLSEEDQGLSGGEKRAEALRFRVWR